MQNIGKDERKKNDTKLIHFYVFKFSKKENYIQHNNQS